MQTEADIQMEMFNGSTLELFPIKLRYLLETTLPGNFPAKFEGKF